MLLNKDVDITISLHSLSSVCNLIRKSARSSTLVRLTHPSQLSSV